MHNIGSNIPNLSMHAKASIVSVVGLLALAGCRSVAPYELPTLEQSLGNPLFAETYADHLVDRMTDFAIRNDAILEDGGKRDAIEEARTWGLDVAKEATRKQREGYIGHFVEVRQQAEGEVLYLTNVLYLSPTFFIAPGPSLRIFLSKSIDPREATEFPDEGSIDLGRLESPYGAQQYRVPETEHPEEYKTVVLYDIELGLIYGFAQLSR